MPRAKATKKQVNATSSETLSDLPQADTVEVANGNGGKDTGENDAIAKIAKKKAARSKKASTVEASQDEKPQKKPAARGKKKIEDGGDAQNGVQDIESKPKGRAKKTLAPTLEPEQGRPKVSKKKTDDSVENEGQIVQAMPKGRPKKTPVSVLESEQESAKTGKTKTRKEIATAPEIEPTPAKPKETAKKEKTATIEETAELPKVVKSRGRKKANEVETGSKSNDVLSAVPAAKRARGTKRLGEADIAEVLEENETEPVKAAVPKKRIKKENVTATTTETKGRDRRKVKNETVEEQKEKAASTKRVTKKATVKSKGNEQKQEEQDEDLIEPLKEIKPVRGRKRVATYVGAEPIEDEITEDSGSKSMLAEVETPGCGGAVLKSLHNVLNFCFPAAAKANNKKEKKAETNGIVDKSYFTSPSVEFNLKVSSWNVAGLRAWLKKDGLSFIDMEEPDIFCLQETKCSNEQLPEEIIRLTGYHPYWLCMPGGYAGVAIYSKIMPINVEYGIGNEEFDDVGRIITAEYEKFFLINVYVPNSGRKLVNLQPRMRWENLFQSFVQKLDALKPVIICGDMNVSHLEIDLANPKSNTRNAGFTKEERDKMSQLLELGYVDTFRHLYPDRKGAYTFWTYMANARARNVGWRLDYCIVSQRFVSRVVDQVFRSQCQGSDHCPITVFLNV